MVVQQTMNNQFSVVCVKFSKEDFACGCHEVKPAAENEPMCSWSEAAELDMSQPPHGGWLRDLVR